MANTTKQSAKLITSAEYLKLNNPEFVGQTPTDDEGEYKMYWKSEELYYFTVNNIFA